MTEPLSWNAERAAAFYDEYGEREWTRFEDGRTPAPSLDVHLDYLRRFVRAGECEGQGPVLGPDRGRVHGDRVRVQSAAGGDAVNLEFDVLAKYVERMLRRPQAPK